MCGEGGERNQTPNPSPRRYVRRLTPPSARSNRAREKYGNTRRCSPTIVVMGGVGAQAGAPTFEGLVERAETLTAVVLGFEFVVSPFEFSAHLALAFGFLNGLQRPFVAAE